LSHFNKYSHKSKNKRVLLNALGNHSLKVLGIKGNEASGGLFVICY